MICLNLTELLVTMSNVMLQLPNRQQELLKTRIGDKGL